MTKNEIDQPFSSVEDAIAAVKRGEIVVVVDDEDRENEGDLIMAAELVTEEQMAFYVSHTSGILCVAMPDVWADNLALPLMVETNTESMGTAFTVSVDAAEGVSTGVSAADRTRTVRLLAADSSVPSSFARPGHIFPLRAKHGGVLKRAGHTEAAVDLMRLAGLNPVGLISEVAKPDGSMARVSDLKKFVAAHDLCLITIADLIGYISRTEKLVTKVSQAVVPTAHGTFQVAVYESNLDGEQHVAFCLGDLANSDDVLVRVHSECLTGDIFGSMRCDCGPQLDLALAKISSEGTGVVVYLRGHEGRGIGLGHKIRAYGLQDEGFDTVDANKELGLPVDTREYGIGAQILSDLGVTSMRLLTNNPAKYSGLEGFGLTITERIGLKTEPNQHNRRYLQTKQDRLGHDLDLG